MLKDTNIKGDYGKILLSECNEKWPPLVLNISFKKDIKYIPAMNITTNDWLNRFTITVKQTKEE